ncbi:MAG: hypothetical protein Q9160_007686 [Pyrenula sp. 1 TL-2023]
MRFLDSHLRLTIVALILWSALSQATIRPRDCAAYTPSKPPYTIRGPEYRASHGINCTTQDLTSAQTPGSTSSPIPSYSYGPSAPICNLTTHCHLSTSAGTIPARSTLNISSLLSSSTSEHHLLHLIGQTTNLDFHHTLNSSFHQGAFSVCLVLGQSGYIGVYPSLQCSEGVLDGCDDNSNGDDDRPGTVPNGTAVTACAPLRFETEASLSFEFVNTTAAETANMTDNPVAPIGGAAASAEHVLKRALYGLVALGLVMNAIA